MQNKRSIFITGTSSGIGHHLALKLADNGYLVFAGVRNETAAQTLAAYSNQIKPVIIDVTQLQQIEQAYQQISNELGGGGLYALINNAGISRLGSLEFCDLDELRHLFDVNVFGVIAITQKFLPLLRRHGGRIINIGSVAGILTMPFSTVYSASKFALEAISDGLRRELQSCNVKVIHFQLGGIESKLWEKISHNLPELTTESNDRIRLYYKNHLQRYINNILKSRNPSANASPDVVFQKLMHALSSKRPQIRYSLGTNHWQARFVSYLPYRLQDWLIYRTYNS